LDTLLLPPTFFFLIPSTKLAPRWFS
jgi:hypothetical protein